MVKKAKKKARAGVKEKQNPVASPNSIAQQDTQKVNAPEDGVRVTAVNEKKICPHIDKGIDVDKVSAKLGSSGPVFCEDCREGAVNRRAGKGKGKHGKKKGGGESKSASTAIWVCLECAHFSCGGSGFPTTPQSHAVRHARQYRHQLAIQFENPQLLWCFPCSRLIPAEKVEDGTEQRDVLQDIVKMIKGRPSGGPSLDVEDVWFGRGSITSEVKSEASLDIGAYGKSGYIVRGLFNLGNTCFFNSIVQNLLAMNRLRDYFLELDECDGPLAAAFKKLFAETSIGDASRNAINPKSFFGSLCAKAPQFRGYQQHDSHELLHCLLDGLCTEELTARKKLKSSQDDVKSPTYVDAIFGGRLSSTVTCLECGHSSLVYEPFLDLSLPVPTKKTPSKKVQPVSRAKKSKHAPKRSGRVRPKISRDAASLNGQSAQESSSKSFCQVQSSASITEGMEAASDCAFLDSLDASSVADNMGLTSHNLHSSLKSNNEKNVNNVTGQLTSVDNFTWLDYLDQDILPNGDMASQITSHDLCSSQKSNNEQNDDSVTGQSTSMDNFTCSEYLDQDIMPKSDDVASKIDILSNQGCATENVVQPNVSLQNDLNAPSDSKLRCGDEACSPDDLMRLADQGLSKSPDCNIATQFGEEVAVKDWDAREVEHKSASNNQVLLADSNLELSASLGEVEAPLQVQDSEILLLPYKEETSDVLKEEGEVSPDAAGCGQEFLDFDGFGGLFNEPEPVAGSAEKPLLNGAASMANGFGEGSSAVGNSTESDPDEVDNTDAPVSVESCLACFTRPELLSKTEHAWQCENCAKLLRGQKKRMKKKLLKPGSGDLGNAPEDSNPRDIDLRATSGSAGKGLSDVFDERLVYQNGANGYSNCMPETSHGADPDLVPHPSDGVHSSQDEACSLVNCDNQNNRVQLDERSANHESGESENETDSKGVKVERDATKRILIDKAPPILTIHLKRFSQDARGRLSKLSGHVNFRDTIDLTTFVDPRCLQREVYKYRLVGVVEHSGTMRGGHYVAYVRGGPKMAGKDEDAEDYVWYYASDAYVREVPLEEVLQSEAYILFYEEI
ncbi:ubiquitin-specific protease ubp2 [Datura stramonium]|uniref:Ubiquitin-specific protease ubp2 n=1 Tax=Datura stramonium TaxID=4076 RepID=A0ABS8RXT7_DATST|nr:ubiquitin-specific protease ubp2 [Datura stramonium]